MSNDEHTDTTQVKCPQCFGTRRGFGVESSYVCPRCWGRGTISKQVVREDSKRELENQREITRSLYVRLNGAYEHAANLQRQLDRANEAVARLAKREMLIRGLRKTLQHVGNLIENQEYDWGTNPEDALIYDVLVGWTFDAMDRLQREHGWTKEHLETIRTLGEPISEVLEEPE